MALGFLALPASSDEITLSLPPDLAARLADAAEHLPPGRVTVAEQGTVTGSPEALRELLAVALDDAGERVASAATALLRGEGSSAQLRAALDEARALLDVLEGVPP